MPSIQRSSLRTPAFARPARYRTRFCEVLSLSSLEVACGLRAGRGLLCVRRVFRHLLPLGARRHAAVKVCDLFGREAVDVRLVVVDARARHNVGLLEAEPL